MNVMPVERRNLMLRLLVEGNSIRSVCRLTTTNIRSVLARLHWAGEHCRRLMDERLRNLTLSHLECDEMWTFVKKKQGRLTTTEKEQRGDIGDVYLWTALDQKTKLIPCYQLGKRSADMARRMMVDLASRLVRPTPHASDQHDFKLGGYNRITQISTDGFAGYPEAVDLAFGPYAKFGTIIKEYRSHQMPGMYSPGEMVGTIRESRRNMGPNEERTICTSHVERNNLTVRTFMKRFNRLTLAFSKKLASLEDAVALHMAYYNFCWRPGKLRCTPAMAAGVTKSLWTFDDLMRGDK